MPQLRNWSLIVAVLAAVSLWAPGAFAEDVLKVIIADRGSWETAAPQLGQQAGIFRKRGIVLELGYVQADSEIEPPVISGSADVGVGAAITDVLRASAGKDAPLRIIGATMTGSAKYWYVAATSPIKAPKDISGRSIGYAKAGQYDVFDFMDRYRIKARPVLGGGEPSALDQVIAGKLDVGWATPPFGLDALEQGRIRVVARANEIPAIRDKTVGVMIASTDTLQKRYEVLVRFLQAYRETIDWMYSDPAAAKAFAEFAGMPDSLALRLRGEFFTKEMLSPDKIVGLSAVAKDATKARAIPASMSKKQLDELVQVPTADRAKASARSSGWFRVLSPRSP